MFQIKLHTQVKSISVKSRINFDVLEITDFSKTKGLLVKVDIEKSIWFCRPKKYDQFNRNVWFRKKSNKMGKNAFKNEYHLLGSKSSQQAQLINTLQTPWKQFIREKKIK